MRALEVFARLAPFFLAFWRDHRRWLIAGGPARRSREAHERRARRLVATVADLGPTFIKLAQVFSARADILPEPYLSAVGTLTDAVPPLAPGVAEAVIEEEFGRPATDVFDNWNPVPLAAASLGQVHRARYGGRDVVVKVLRPGVEDQVRRDLDASFRILFLLQIVFRNHHVRAMGAIVSEFAKRVGSELDFREEAQNAMTLRRNFAAEPRVVIPEVVVELIGPRVLVLEYLEGTRIDRLKPRIDSGELSLSAVITTLIEAYIKMMLEDGFFHADPHFGNLFVDAQGRLVIVDFGMVLRVDRDTQSRLISTVLAAARQDVDGVINGFYALGILDPDVDRGTIRDAARQILSVTLRDEASHRQIQRVVEDVLQTFYDWPLMLPAELVYFGRAAALVEGIGLRYDPGFNTLAVAKPIVERASGRLLQGQVGKEARSISEWGIEAAQLARTLRDLLHRVEREEFRVRMHPRDSLEMQRYFSRQLRRLMVAAAALTLGIVTAVLFAATRRLELLVIGLLTASGIFGLALILPAHLFQNPLRFRRRRM